MTSSRLDDGPAIFFQTDFLLTDATYDSVSNACDLCLNGEGKQSLTSYPFSYYSQAIVVFL